jgi:hypothetical protein
MGDPWAEEGFGGDDEWEGGESLAETGDEESELDLELEELVEPEEVEPADEPVG